MSCNNCASRSHINNAGTTSVKGCPKGGCASGSCEKLGVFDWLSNLSMPTNMTKFDCVEVRFKNSRKEFYRNTENFPLYMGDVVVTETSSGYDVGVVSLTGELVRVQMSKKNVNSSKNLPKIYRKATESDIEIWQNAREKEPIVQKKSRELALALNLEMKISDVEYQGDGSKATFYYSAEERIDFRQLIKDMAREFSIRIEMRQIGLRQEASRLGGIGSCGRELCCSTWLTDFRSVSTSAARYQQLSLNPQKLAGQCGKLKCCLNFELDSYTEALKEFPRTDTRIFTEKGVAICQKIDIFKRLMWFAYEDHITEFHKLTLDQVKELLKMVSEKKSIANIEMYADNSERSLVSVDVLEKEELKRFDEPKRKKKKKKNNAGKENNTISAENEKNTPKKVENSVKKEGNRQNTQPKNEKQAEKDTNTQNEKPKAENSEMKKHRPPKKHFPQKKTNENKPKKD